MGLFSKISKGLSAFSPMTGFGLLGASNGGSDAKKYNQQAAADQKGMYQQGINDYNKYYDQAAGYYQPQADLSKNLLNDYASAILGKAYGGSNAYLDYQRPDYDAIMSDAGDSNPYLMQVRKLMTEDANKRFAARGQYYNPRAILGMTNDIAQGIGGYNLGRYNALNNVYADRMNQFGGLLGLGIQGQNNLANLYAQRGTGLLNAAVGQGTQLYTQGQDKAQLALSTSPLAQASQMAGILGNIGKGVSGFMGK